MRDSVTFRDPVATSLKTSFQEWAPLQIATGNLHLRPLASEIQVFQQPNKKSHHGETFDLVGDEGLEPPTSSLSVTRSNQLS